MIPVLFLGIFTILQPFTISGSFWDCEKNKCPELMCGDGWQYEGYDMSGRKYTTCRRYTPIGKEFNDTHKRVMGHVENCFK